MTSPRLPQVLVKMGSIICCSTLEKVEDSKDSGSPGQDENVSISSIVREASSLTIFPRGS